MSNPSAWKSIIKTFQWKWKSFSSLLKSKLSHLHLKSWNSRDIFYSCTKHPTWSFPFSKWLNKPEMFHLGPGQFCPILCSLYQRVVHLSYSPNRQKELDVGRNFATFEDCKSLTSSNTKRKRNLLNVKITWGSKFDFHFVRIKYLKEKQKVKVFIGWIRNEDKKKLNESIHRKCVRNLKLEPVIHKTWQNLQVQ